MRGVVTAHMLSFVNRRHVTADKIEAAMRDIIDCYHQFALPRVWGGWQVGCCLWQLKLVQFGILFWPTLS